MAHWKQGGNCARPRCCQRCRSPRFLGHAVSGCLLRCRIASLGCAWWPLSPWTGPCLEYALLEGHTEGLQSPAQLPLQLLHQERHCDDVMASSLRLTLVGGSVCSGTGACSTWRARNRPSVTSAFLALLARLPSLWRFGCTLVPRESGQAWT